MGLVEYNVSCISVQIIRGCVVENMSQASTCYVANFLNLLNACKKRLIHKLCDCSNYGQ